MKYSIKKYIAKLSGEKQKSLEGNELNHKYFAAFEAESLEDQQAVFANSNAETKWKILISWCFDYKKGYKSLLYREEIFWDGLKETLEISYDQRDWPWLAKIVEASAEWLGTDTTFNSLLPTQSMQLFLIIKIFYKSDTLRAAVHENTALLAKLREFAYDSFANGNIHKLQVIQLLLDEQKFFEDIWHERGGFDYKDNHRKKISQFHLKNEPWLINRLTAKFLLYTATPEAKTEIFLTNFLYFKQKYPQDIEQIEWAITSAYLRGGVRSEERDFHSLLRGLEEKYCSDSPKDLMATLASLRIDYENFKFSLKAEDEFYILSPEDIEIRKKKPNHVLWSYMQDLNSRSWPMKQTMQIIKKRIETAVRHFRLQAIEILDGVELLSILELSNETLLMLIEDLMQDSFLLRHFGKSLKISRQQLSLLYCKQAFEKGVASLQQSSANPETFFKPQAAVDCFYEAKKHHPEFFNECVANLLQNSKVKLTEEQRAMLVELSEPELPEEAQLKSSCIIS